VKEERKRVNTTIKEAIMFLEGRVKKRPNLFKRKKLNEQVEIRLSLPDGEDLLHCE
jgi:hypothetical protein